MTRPCFLVVDREHSQSISTRKLVIETAKFNVLTAYSAEEALELLRSHRPDMVLADVQLPGMDGLEMARRIKLEEATRGIAVVALTAFAMGALAGMLIRRVVPAIVATLAGYTVLAVVVGDVLRANYQPASHFWQVQAIEGGGLLALSALLIAATVWLVHRRAA